MLSPKEKSVVITDSCLVVGVQQFVCFMRIGLAQILVIKLLNLCILVGLTQSLALIFGIQCLGALGPESVLNVIILMGQDFDNPWGQTTPKGVVKKMSQILNSAVFPGIQGGPLEHVIAAKAVAFGEALEPAYKEYQAQVIKNAQAMAEAFVKRGYKIVSGGTDNHLMLVDLRTKFPELTGKLAEKCLVAAGITTNKNMVPFDSRSAFQTSGLRFGTPAITTRGLKEQDMETIVALVDRVLQDPENEANIAAVRKDVNAMMEQYQLFAW